MRTSQSVHSSASSDAAVIQLHAKQTPEALHSVSVPPVPHLGLETLSAETVALRRGHPLTTGHLRVVVLVGKVIGWIVPPMVSAYVLVVCWFLMEAVAQIVVVVAALGASMLCVEF